MIQELIQIGFNEEQAKVFVALSELGKANIARIVRKSGVSKKLSYKALDFFMNEGYVASEGDKKRLFFVADVELIGLKLQDRLQRFQTVLPELLSTSNSAVSSRKAFTTFADAESIRSLIKYRMRRAPKESLLMGVESALFNFRSFMEAGRGGGAFDIYERLRVNKRVQIKILIIDSSESFRNNPMALYDHKRLFREFRYTTSQLQNDLSQIYIWHDRVWFLTYQSENKMSLIEIVNKDIRQGFVVYFDSLWQTAEVVK